MQNRRLYYLTGLVTFFFGFITNNTYCQNLKDMDCSSMKEGVYNLNDNSTYEIVRAGDTQQEKDLKTGIVSEYDIKWLSSCEYILFNKKIIKGNHNINTKIDTIHNYIKQIDGNKFTVLSTIKKYSFSDESVLIKIR